MAEFDPSAPKDATESAYAQTLLGDDTGREQRRARLMAALPRPPAAQAGPVSRAELAWRWRPHALGLLAAGLLLAAVLAWRAQPSAPRPATDPRLAAGSPASEATVVAQADLAVEPPRAPVAAAPRIAAKANPAKPRIARHPPVVVADATLPRSRNEGEPAAAAIEPVSPVAPPPPAAPVMAAAPPARVAESMAPAAPKQAETLARSGPVSSAAAARARMPSREALGLASSATAEPAKALTAADASLLAAVLQADRAAARSALQVGASAHLRDAQGRTVLMLAARTGARDVVDLLLAAGARKADSDPRGWTAADHAQAQGHGELADTLR